MAYLLSCIIGYLFGCIQTSYLVGKVILKKDIRKMGNGNAGASNATMVFGKAFGLLTALVDILKGFIALLFIRSLFGGHLASEGLMSLLHLGGLFVIFGHNFPFYMNFRGGKGTAALVGVLFALDWKLGLSGIFTIIVVTLVTDYIALGTMALLAVFLGYSLVFHPQVLTLVADLVIVVMSIYKHRSNLVKIRHGEEKSVKKTLSKKT